MCGQLIICTIDFHKGLTKKASYKTHWFMQHNVPDTVSGVGLRAEKKLFCIIFANKRVKRMRIIYIMRDFIPILLFKRLQMTSITVLFISFNFTYQNK